MVNRMQEQDEQLSLKDMDTKNHDKWYRESQEPLTQPGMSKGLMLVLDAHTDAVSSGTVFDNFQGFVTTIQGSDQFPSTLKSSYLIRPGQFNSIAMSAVSIDVDAEDLLRSIPPQKNKVFKRIRL